MIIEQNGPDSSLLKLSLSGRDQRSFLRLKSPFIFVLLIRPSTSGVVGSELAGFIPAFSLLGRSCPSMFASLEEESIPSRPRTVWNTHGAQSTSGSVS